MSTPRIVIAALAALALSACAVKPRSDVEPVASKGESAPVATTEAQDEGAPGDLLAKARAIAASKGLGERPGGDAAAREAIAAAVLSAPKTARAPIPQGAAGYAQDADDLADMNARIRLAALRLRAEGSSGRSLHAPAETGARTLASEDPREIFRRAQERHGQSSARNVFGTLDPALAPSGAEAAPGEMIEALRNADDAPPR